MLYVYNERHQRPSACSCASGFENASGLVVALNAGVSEISRQSLGPAGIWRGGETENMKYRVIRVFLERWRRGARNLTGKALAAYKRAVLLQAA